MTPNSLIELDSPALRASIELELNRIEAQFQKAVMRPIPKLLAVKPSSNKEWRKMVIRAARGSMARDGNEVSRFLAEKHADTENETAGKGVR